MTYKTASSNSIAFFKIKKICVCVCSSGSLCAQQVCRCQKKALDPLGLELQTTVNCYVDSWNQTLVLWKLQRLWTTEPSLHASCTAFSSLPKPKDQVLMQVYETHILCHVAFSSHRVSGPFSQSSNITKTEPSCAQIQTPTANRAHCRELLLLKIALVTEECWEREKSSSSRVR